MKLSLLYISIVASLGIFGFIAFFAAMMVCQFVWALFFMPETKGGTTVRLQGQT